MHANGTDIVSPQASMPLLPFFKMSTCLQILLTPLFTYDVLKCQRFLYADDLKILREKRSGYKAIVSDNFMSLFASSFFITNPGVAVFVWGSEIHIPPFTVK